MKPLHLLVFYKSRKEEKNHYRSASFSPSRGLALVLAVLPLGAACSVTVAVAELQINKLLIGLLGVMWEVEGAQGAPSRAGFPRFWVGSHNKSKVI